MTAAAALAIAALAASGADAAPEPRLSLLTEGALSAAHDRRGFTTVGLRATVRAGRGALVIGFDVPAPTGGAQPRIRSLVLAGPGVAGELSPRLGAHAALLYGLELWDLDEYVDGKSRDFAEGAVGGRVGLEWHDRSRGVAPVLGLSSTVVWVRPGSDRLRGVEWGGWTALVTLTVGLELSRPLYGPPGAEPAPPAAPLPEPEPAPAPQPPRPAPAPRPARATAEVEVAAGAGDAPSVVGGLRVTWAPAPAIVLAADWENGENEPGEIRQYVTAGAGARTLRRGFALEALAVGGVLRVEESDAAGWHARNLAALGARAGAFRAPRGGGASFLYGASATVLWSPTVQSVAGRGAMGGVAATFAASIGLAL